MSELLALVILYKWVLIALAPFAIAIIVVKIRG
jgi:hypothetical protein